MDGGEELEGEGEDGVEGAPAEGEAAWGRTYMRPARRKMEMSM